MEDNFDPDVAFDDRPCTRLGNFEALENFHKALLEADDPLDVIELVDDNRHWIVEISLFGRRWSPYRDRWLEVEEERENEEVEEEEEGRINGDPATRHNKQELAQCFNLFLEILSHFQYHHVGVSLFFDEDDEIIMFLADNEYEETEQPPEEQSTKKAAISEVRVLFDCGSHRSTDTDLPFWKLLELSQRMSRKIDLPWQFFVDPGQIQISDSAKFQAKQLQVELHNQQTLTALTTFLEQERFPKLESIGIQLRGSEQRNLGGLLEQLGTFSLLPSLHIFQYHGYTTFSVSDSTALSSLRLRELELQGIAFASETAMRAFVDGLVETGAFISSIETSSVFSCILPEEGILYLLKEAPKLCNLSKLILYAENPAPADIEALRSAYRQCNKESTSLQYLSVSSARRTKKMSEEAIHYWNLNEAGRRAIQDLPSISPPGLVTVLLNKAQEAYQENGIYHMLREHADLRTIVAECNGSDGKQRPSNKKQKTAL